MPLGGAATTEQIVADYNTGLAILGFDPVAYFVDGAAEAGRPEFEYRFGGVVWRFRNAGNRRAFIADPEIYRPRFGGYDPVAVARGVAVAGDPRQWLIVDEQLYLFRDPSTRQTFAADSTGIGAAADRSWPRVLLTLSP
ncbi:MAG: hypothetical protein IT537_00360 [Hyphomicrobiales bacterium]|nr:hypothetical protein [Hyphomicrobiales bacterium]